MKTLIAIDPGVTGGIAVLSTGTVLRADAEAYKMPETCKDLHELLLNACYGGAMSGEPFVVSRMNTRVYVEEVSGFIGKRQPGSRMFNFGRGYGQIEGILTAMRVPYVMVRPQAWQRALNIPKTSREKVPGTVDDLERLSIESGNTQAEREHKHVMRELAQRLYPTLKVTLGNCDALLLLEYARQKEGMLAPEKPELEKALL